MVLGKTLIPSQVNIMPLYIIFKVNVKKNYGSFLWGTTASRLQSYKEEAVYFLLLKFPEISGTQLIDFRRMKD